MGVNRVQGTNIHTIAIQVPKTDLTRDCNVPTDPMDAASVIGVWATASRQQSRMRDGYGRSSWHGPWMQVSRLGNPLFNEVIVPMASKDRWNSLPPSSDSQFAQYVTKPELAGLLPVLYPGAFPHLAAYTKPRADLAAILLTGIPTGVVRGSRTTPAPTQADMLRLNVAIPPTAKPEPDRAGRRRPGRVPERAAADRRRRHDRVAGNRRGDDPVGRSDVHAGRSSQLAHRWHEEYEPGTDGDVPVCRRPN